MVSCKGKVVVSPDKVVEKPDQVMGNDFFTQDEGFIMDTLYMDVVLSTCGEWGGPREEYKMYEEGKKYKLEYIKYRYSCDSLQQYYGKEPVVDKKKTIDMTVAESQQVSRFFIELMNEKIGRRHLSSHAGNVFVLHDRDSTLLVDVYTDSKRTKSKYLELKKGLGL